MYDRMTTTSCLAVKTSSHSLPVTCVSLEGPGRRDGNVGTDVPRQRTKSELATTSSHHVGP